MSSFNKPKIQSTIQNKIRGRTNNNENNSGTLQQENRSAVVPHNSAVQQQQQQAQQFFPSTLVTTITADLLDKMRDSTESYRNVATQIEEIVMLGTMKGLDERTILMQCKAVLENNPIVEVDV